MCKNCETINNRVRRKLYKEKNNDKISSLINGALKRGGESKPVKESIGYSISELRNHLEKQFIKGMTWDKFMNGEIHIDHIIPKAAFDLTDIQQWRICWGLPNLRPMWAKDNLTKSAKIIYLL